MSPVQKWICQNHRRARVFRGAVQKVAFAIFWSKPSRRSVDIRSNLSWERRIIGDPQRPQQPCCFSYCRDVTS
jgi:hypothetical protein